MKNMWVEYYDHVHQKTLFISSNFEMLHDKKYTVGLTPIMEE